jgi:hypothetical protein
VQKNWFDYQFRSFVQRVDDAPQRFNGDLANNNLPDAHGVPLAMWGAVSRVTGEKIKKGQFEIDFFGPPYKTIKTAKLIKVLGGVNSLKVPQHAAEEECVPPMNRSFLAEITTHKNTLQRGRHISRNL